MTETPTLAAALVKFQAEMPTVGKDRTAKVPTKNGGEYSYTYAGLADIVKAAMPILTKHGLSFSCCPRRTDQGDYDIVGVLLHTSGEKLEGALPVQGATAQQIGSSLTYGRRYLFGCMTGLVTDDDDDGTLANQAPPAERRRSVDQDDPWAMDPDDPKPMSDTTRKRMFALFGKKGIAEADQLTGINQMLGKEYASRGDLTEADAQRVIAVVSRKPDAPKEKP